MEAVEELFGRAEWTVQRASRELEQSPDDLQVRTDVAATASRAMLQAVNAIFLALGIPANGSDVVLRFQEKVVRPGLVPQDALRCLLDGQDVGARVVYQAGVAFSLMDAKAA